MKKGRPQKSPFFVFSSFLISSIRYAIQIMNTVPKPNIAPITLVKMIPKMFVFSNIAITFLLYLPLVNFSKALYNKY